MFGRLKAALGRAGAAARVGALVAEAERRSTAGERDAAVRLLRDAVAADADDPRPLLPLALALRDSGQLDEAAGLLKQSIRLEPGSVDAHFVLGLVHQQRGAAAEAPPCFQAVIALAPDLPDGYTALCQVQVSAGNADAAREAVQKGLARLPEHAPFHFLLANLRLQAGDFDAAEVSYRQAIHLQPDWPEAHYNRALAMQGAGRPEEAVAHLCAALDLRPEYAAAALARAGLHLAAGRHVEALRDYDRVLDVQPQAPEALSGRAAAYLRVGRAAEALADLDRLLRIQPRADAWLNRASALLALGRHEEALSAIDSASALSPSATAAGAQALLLRARALRALRRNNDALAAARQAAAAAADASLLNDLGLLLRDLGDREAAHAAFDRALSLQAGFAAALANRGLLRQELYRAEEALADLDAALRIDPGLVDAHVNRGNVLQELERHNEALQAYSRAFAIKPDLEGAYLNESLSRLITGDLAGGWPRYEWRWHSNRISHPASQFAQPIWDGSQSLNGKTIFIYAEQGLGDTLQFCRYAEPLKARGAAVILAVQRPLAQLLRGMPCVDRLLVQGEPTPAFDYHAPLLSLPGAFSTSIESIPAKTAYVFADGENLSDRRRAWRTELRHLPAPRIGLVWSGNAQHKNDRNRSIPLADFRRIVDAPGTFVCLQNELRPADAATLELTPQIRFVGPQLVDFSATAALVAELDLVISVDTSVAHLAAAMGKPVWLLLPVNPDWRWLLAREDSPWYPTMRLFRQTRRGEWRDVLERVREELARRFP